MRFILMLLGGLALLISSANAQKHPDVVISGEIQTGHASDTIQLIIRGEFSHDGDAEFSPLKNEITVTRNGRFSFTVPGIEHPVHADIYINPQRHPVNNILQSEGQLQFLLLEPGDSIRVTGRKGNLIFSGKGSAKWDYRQSQIFLHGLYDNMKPSYRAAGDKFDHDRYIEDGQRLKNALLESFRRRLSREAWIIFDADIRGSYGFYYLMKAGRVDSRNAPRSQEQKHFYEQYVRDMHIDTSNAALVRWSGYPGFVRRKLSIDYEYAKLNGAVAERNLYEYAANRLHGILQEKVLMLIMEMDIAFSKLSDETLDFMEARVKTPVYRKRIGEMKETYATGSEMIDFAFRDKDDKTVRLSDFRGKVVLLDMWFTGCSGCVAVANTLPAVEEAFRSNDSVVFVSLSIDRHRDLWLQSIDPDKKIVAGKRAYTHYTTPTTVYLYTGGTGSHSPFIRKYVPGSTYPHLLLVGKDGKVFAADPPNPAFEGGQEKLTALIRRALERPLK
ncbi:TlpA family protein disulfide reductase [Chitinophaga sp. 22620]|uniref:TlpA family protein disulfide reductase n=1 Tax=Chitinophaga sp. 22620 TaxID=3453952 RepID=UPI003F84F009